MWCIAGSTSHISLAYRHEEWGSLVSKVFIIFKVFYNYKSFLSSFFCYHRVHINISGIVKFISLCEAITYSCIYMS